MESMYVCHNLVMRKAMSLPIIVAVEIIKENRIFAAVGITTRALESYVCICSSFTEYGSPTNISNASVRTDVNSDSSRGISVF
jgi:hypothetical protein